MLIYFAGPLFSAAERRFNLDFTQRLEAVGYHVFLPQRDRPAAGYPMKVFLLTAWKECSPEFAMDSGR